MSPKISISRKRDHVYLVLTGCCNTSSAHDVLYALEKVLKTSLQASPPDAVVEFTFKTQARVNGETMNGGNGARGSIRLA